MSWRNSNPLQLKISRVTRNVRWANRSSPTFSKFSEQRFAYERN